MDNLPPEVLASILKLYIMEYFKEPRDPLGYPPAPLHVSRKWREVAINNAGCWTRLKFTLNTRSKYGYGVRNISQRPTKGKAAQDALGTYFKWAKNLPIDLFLEYTTHCSQDAQRKLEPWLLQNIPKLRSFHQGRCWGRFDSMFLRFGSATLTHLTYLFLTIQDNTGFQDLGSGFTAPNLLFAHIGGESSVLKIITAPKLKSLFVKRWNPRDLVLLGKYLLLSELVTKRFTYGEDFEALNVCHNGVCRLVIDNPYNDTVLGQFLTISHDLFPKVTCWRLKSGVAERLACEGVALEPDFSFLTKLSIAIYPTRTRMADDLPTAQVHSKITAFWKRFPQLTHLILGVDGPGALHPDFTIERDTTYPYEDQEPGIISKFLTETIRLLGTIPHRDLAGSRLLPSLQQLDLEDLILEPWLFLILANLISGHDTGIDPDDRPGRQVTIRRCILKASRLDPPCDFTIEEITVSDISDFEKFTASLDQPVLFADLADGSDNDQTSSESNID